MSSIYILQSLKNDTYYVGSTRNVDVRLRKHLAGGSMSTKHLLPLKLVFSQDYNSYKSAYQAERWLKKQKDRKLIEKIIKEGKINRVF